VLPAERSAAGATLDPPAARERAFLDHRRAFLFDAGRMDSEKAEVLQDISSFCAVFIQ